MRVLVLISCLISLCSAICRSLFRYLKPDVKKKSKHKTSVIKKTLNPEFNEVWMCLKNLEGSFGTLTSLLLRMCVSGAPSVNEMSAPIFLCAASAHTSHYSHFQKTHVWVVEVTLDFQLSHMTKMNIISIVVI